jgi:hypothetical protein
MALFRNFGVDHFKDVKGLAESLVRLAEPSASAQCRRFELAKNGTFLDRKRISALDRTADGY